MNLIVVLISKKGLSFLSWVCFSSSPEFLIQYEDLLHEPGVWINLTEVAGTSTTAQLNLSPYVYYSFRVMALNSVGLSEPSQSSSQYRTNPAGEEHGHSWEEKKTALCKISIFHWLSRRFLVFVAPDDNPTDVRGEGTEPGNLVISWTVSYIILWAWKTFHSSRVFKRCHVSANNNKLFSV